MSVSKQLRAGIAVSSVLLSCQLAACGSDTVDYGSGGSTSSGGKAGIGQGGKAGSGHAGSGHGGQPEAEAGMAGDVELGGSGGLGTSGGGAGGLAHGGAGGSSGASAGGASAGAGGKAGAGGSGGVGGASAGSGGKAGAGGAGAGAGGSIVGTGGNSGGSAGASVGGGGASAGSGGANTGNGGSSSLTCGNGTLDSGEVCDAKFTVNNCGSDCKAITPSTCITCENGSACSPSVLTCDTATGNASAGPANGVAKSALCNETLDCVRDSGCAADGQPAFKFCYCGTANVSDCNAGLANGPCKTALERSLETTSAADISARIGNAAYGGGVAMKRITCDQNFCADFCF